MHIKVRELITNGATKVCVISVHVKLYLCVAGTRVRARWWVKMPGPFFNPSPSLVKLGQTQNRDQFMAAF